MGNLNKVFLLGRLGQEPEIRYVGSNGTAVVNLSLATQEFTKGANDEWETYPEWHRVTLWARLAELVGEHCNKGDQIFIEGSLATQEWEDEDGNNRRTTYIKGKNVQLLEDKREKEEKPKPKKVTKKQSKGGKKNTKKPTHQKPPDMDDDYSTY